MNATRIGDFAWELPVGYVDGMRVPARIFATENLFAKAVEDRAVEQVANVATLPGVVEAALAMPDIHWGYGFPIGGVAATDADSGGVVSPGGVGFDIGCGVRLLRSDLRWTTDVKQRVRELVDALGRSIPRGVGGKGRLPLRGRDLERVLVEGAALPVSNGVGTSGDLEHSEDSGVLQGADPGAVSDRALERGGPQLGSLGAGNHFLEIQVVEAVLDATSAEALGLFEDQVCIMIHSGSRGIGHQVCTDHLKRIDRLMPTLGIHVPDRQLACVPLDHPAAQSYLGAMNAAGNFARANRQVLAQTARESVALVLRRSTADLAMDTVYDVSHNLAKIESYEVSGETRLLCVHRKGATRAFGPGHPEIPSSYSSIGQPVLVPGSMGSASFVLVGRAGAEKLSFASTCHGAGRAMSRTQAKKIMGGKELKEELEGRGILVAKSQLKLLAEEAPYAYKDAQEVVDACEGAGLSSPVARLQPVGVIKG
jgi:tRNA-splicing ligase RtcB (3'-phosphate/5'-hydroxy nucleic acid ligase)